MIGSTVSHYRIVEKIGEGGMGEVYLAEDTKLKRKVALKFLAKELTQDETRKQRFIQEARAAAAIEHPHIAAIHDIDEADGHLFIAMEHVRGESLREVIEHGSLGARRSLELAAQIADGLSAAHEQGVVHRDLKPENILVSDKGYAKIIDFGLAKLLEPFVQSGEASDFDATATRLKTKEGMVMGTVAYMSPEQAKGKPVDARSDVFSYGAVLYEMLSGQSPFRRETLAESLSAVLKETPGPVRVDSAELAPDLQRILRKALAKDPNDRYQSMRDLAIDIRDLREGMTTSASIPVVPTPAAAKLPWKWAAVVAVGVALALAGFLLLRDRGPAGIGASGRPSVAVMYFESMSGDEEIRWLSRGLPNMLLTDLAQTPGLDVVSSQRIHEILEQIGQEDLETIDKSVVTEVARRAGAGAVVVGSVFKSGDEVRIDVQVEDVSTGRILSADSVRGADVFPLVDQLTNSIRSSLDMGDQPGGKALADVTTESLEAFQLYTDGLDASLNIRYADARKLLEQAVAIDPSFAMAYFQLARVTDNQGEGRLSREYLEKVLANLNRLPERQKLLVQAAELNREGKEEESAALLESLITSYPDEEGAYVDLRFAYQTLNQPDRALATLERGIEAIPQSGPLRNDYGYQLLWLGRYPEAIRQLETYAELSPDEPNPYDSLAEAYMISGNPEEALEKYARALEVDPSFGVSHAGRAWAFGMLGQFDEALSEWGKGASSGNPAADPETLSLLEAFTLSRVGRYREAEERVQRGAEVSLGQGNPVAGLARAYLSVIVHIENADFSEAVQATQDLENTVSQIPDPAFRSDMEKVASFLAGMAEVRRSNLDSGREHLGSLARVYDAEDEMDRWFYETLNGEIALAAGDLATAEEAFHTAEPELKMFFNMGSGGQNILANNSSFRDGLARLKKARGDLPGAIAEYRKLLTTDISSKWTAMLEPRFVLALARLLGEAGDRDAARAEYRRFLDLWKNADPGLPELAEARAYVN
jgi:tetratricopeptide (TPR) repeat protein